MLIFERLLILFLFPIFLFIYSSSFASDCNYELYETSEPKKGSIEANLAAAEQGKKIHELAQKNLDTLGCKRLFLYEGVLHPIDSYQKRDGEKLRPFFVDIPESLNALNRYQANRSRIQNVAYIGTAGVALVLVSLFFKEDLGQLAGLPLSDIFLYSGAGVTAGSLGYSVWILSQNEKNLERAVEMYNMKKSQQKIELKFSTGFVF